mgnify:CR=1 FL=1
MGALLEPFTPQRLQQLAMAQQGNVVEQQPLLLDAAAVGGHGAGGDPPHVGMVAAAGHKAPQAIPLEHRRDHGEIRQMGAAIEWVVGHHRIPRRQGPMLAALHGRQQGPHALAHGSQMHGDVRGIGHQTTGRIKQGAGKIQALLDVHRRAGLLKPRAHLLGDGREAVAKQLQPEIGRAHV